MQAHVTFDGFGEVRRFLARCQTGAQAAERLAVVVGSSVHYARYQEFGTRRGVRARYFLTNAYRAVVPRVAPEVARAIPQGPQAVERALLRLGYQVEAGAKRAAPVKTGTLRRSLHTRMGVRR